MMRRWKKIGALALATTLSLSLAACGGGNNKSADGTLTMQIWDTAQRDAMQALADAYHEINPDVTIEAAVPFAGQADRWPAADQARRLALLDQCDLETVVQHTYTPGCMGRRNRYMVDRSSLLLAVYDGTPRGGTMNTLAYAMRQGVQTVILPVEEEVR